MGRIILSYFAVALFASTALWAEPPVGRSERLTDTTYIAIDLAHITYPTPSSDVSEGTAPSARGIGPSPFIVGRTHSIMAYNVIIETLDRNTGIQLGNRLTVPLPASKTPVDILSAAHFSFGLGRGVGPSPFIVFSDLTLHTFDVTYGVDGTPSAGTAMTIDLGLSPIAYGFATSLTELPGLEFPDSQPRLIIGTDMGYIITLVNAVGAGIVVDDIFLVSVPPAPIVDLQPIPQYQYLALGALINNQVYGIHYQTTPDSDRGRLAPVFYLQDPRQIPMTGFDTFGPHDVPLTRPDTTVGLIIADGTDMIGLTPLSATLGGVQTLGIAEDKADAAIKSVVTGSLMMLCADESAILFDPAYSAVSGSSPCNVNITDAIADVCGYTCGNANGDGAINTGDAVYIVSYIFRGGPAPVPVFAGDANCDGKVTVGDAVYIVSYIFRGGPAPCCP